jgi:hypothetical protein
MNGIARCIFMSRPDIRRQAIDCACNGCAVAKRAYCSTLYFASRASMTFFSASTFSSLVAL